ncbi:CDK5 regulatory subunit-associated protein 2 isoform X2 [Engraulis encrasicolus]|uniref:CDK5 regulatory subunit-associated protein 2 isoform X2 n=1 Tax=Engraulis encrasicolus TaxID=184585 RepID=UPI002FD1D0EE
MDSVVGEDQTLPFDINGSTFTRLPDGIPEFSMDDMSAPTFPPGKMSPSKALTMKDYENQITAFKKENFNLKLRIYFLEERMQQKCDDSTEDIYKTNIELKVEVESLKRDLSEKQELLVSASKALESLANRDLTDAANIRERAHREIDALREALNQRINELEENLRDAEGEVERMAAIAEQHKRNNMELQRQLQDLGQSQASTGPDPAQQAEALQERDRLIVELKASLKNRDNTIGQLQKASAEQQPAAGQIAQLNAAIGQKDGELQTLKDELNLEKQRAEREIKICEQQRTEVARLEAAAKQLTQELSTIRNKNQTLEIDNQDLNGKLEEKEVELDKERKNSLKRDKTIQGLSLMLKEKEKEIEDLYRDLEEREQALVKARDGLHKAQLQKYQGAEEQQGQLLECQGELSRLQGDLHACVCECKRLERMVGSRDSEVQRLTHELHTLHDDFDALQHTKQRQDKTINDLQNQLKKLSGELGEKQSESEKEHSEQLEESKRREHRHETTIQRLTHTLTHKEQQLQEYMNMVRDVESQNPAGNDLIVSKLRERLKEKEKALEAALDEKFAAVEEKENEVHQLQLSLREKERDQERLNNMLTHNQETIASLDALVKERDVELQQQVNSLKNLERSRQSSEDSLNRALRERDALIQQLQTALESKTKDLEELFASVLSKSQEQDDSVAERLSQRLKVAEAELASALRERERLLNEHQSTVDTLLSTINSKEQLLQDSSDRHSRALREREVELQELRARLTHAQRQLSEAQSQSAASTQDAHLTVAQLRAQLAEKDDLVNKLLEQGQERDRYLAELKSDVGGPQVLELRQTIELLQQRLEERDDGGMEKVCGESPNARAKTVAALKKQLAARTENLDKARQREEELEGLVSVLEAQLKEQSDRIETLIQTLSTKEEIIDQLQRDECRGSGPPERESTSIGGDSKETLPPLSALRMEWEGLNRALRAEQQLYSNLVRSVKQQDSAARLQALQLELTAVQLLRQQLEDSILANEKLRQQLEQDLHRANQTEGEELQSLRSALEEARRWNTSLQARLGQIQSRGGGVGQANDTSEFPSVIADQTSYMSICWGEAKDSELDHLSISQLKMKVAELQVLNAELQKRVAQSPEPLSQSQQSCVPPSIPLPQPPEVAGQTNADRWRDASTQVAADIAVTSRRGSETMLLSVHVSTEARLSRDQSSEHSPLLSPVRSSQKEQRSRESKESADASGCDSDSSPCDLRHTIQRLRSEARGHRQVITQLKEQLQRSAAASQSDDTGSAAFDPELIVAMAREMERLKEENEASHRRAKSLEGRLHEHQEREDKERRMREKEKRAAQKTEGGGEALVRRERRKGRRDMVGEEERGTTEDSRDGESASSKSTSPVRKPVDLIARHAAYVKSRLPVLARSSSRGAADHAVCDGARLRSPPYPAQRNLIGCEESASPSPRSSQQSSPGRGATTTSSSSSSRSPVHSSGQHQEQLLTLELETQVELLQQECQEKEGLLQRNAQQWREMEAELQEKERLMAEYLQALKAAKSTIAYLTACSLDTESGVGVGAEARPGSLWGAQNQEPDSQPHGLGLMSTRLQECVRRAEEAIANLAHQSEEQQEEDDEAAQSGTHTELLLARLEELHVEVRALRGGRDPQQGQLQADTVREAMWEQRTAELQEQLQAAEAKLQALNVNAKGDHPASNSADAVVGPQANTAKATDGHCAKADASDAKLDARNDANSAKSAEGKPRSPTKAKSGSRGVASPPALSPDSSSVSGQDANNSNSTAEGEALQSGKGIRRVLPKMADLRSNAQREECLRECVRAVEGVVEALVTCCSSADPNDLSDPSHISDRSGSLSPSAASLAQHMNRLLRALHQKSRLDGLAAPTHTSTPKVLHPHLNPHPHLNLNPALILVSPTLERCSPQVLEEPSPVQPVVHQQQHSPSKSRGHHSGSVASTKNQQQSPTKAKAHQTSPVHQSTKQGNVAARSRAPHHPHHPLRGPGGGLVCPSPGDLHHNMLLLLQLFRERAQTVGLLEERLASLQDRLDRSAQAVRNIAPSAATSEERVQDQGYETSGRSEPEASSTDVDVVLDLASSPSYPSSPGLSLTPRPLADPPADPCEGDPALLRQHLAQLRAQLESQQRVIQHLQAGGRRSSLPAGLLTPTSAEEGEEGVDDKKDGERAGRGEHRSRLAPGDLSKDGSTLNRSALCLSASPSRIESLVQSQARELCELRRQIRMSGLLGVEQRQVLLELRGALEEIVQLTVQHQPGLGTHIQHSLDHSLELLDMLQPGDLSSREEQHSSDKDQRVCAELQQKSGLIRSLQERLAGVRSPSGPQGSVSRDNSTTSLHSSHPDGFTTSAAELKVTNGVSTGVDGVLPEPGVGGEEGGSGGGGRALLRENGRLAEQLRSSEQLNETLRSELELHRSLLTHTQKTQQASTHRSTPTPEQPGAHTDTGTQADAASRSINTDLLAEHLQEIRALRQRLEETIRTNERLREQLERRLQEANRDPAGTNIFIAGLEDQGQLANEVRKLWAHNHTLREQLNLGTRDKQKENERLRETLARRTAKLERSRREHTRLQDSLQRLQCEVKQQKQQLSDSQQLLKSLRVELKLQEHIRSTEGQEQSSGVDLAALLAEVRHLREQLERSIRNHTININYLLPSDECGRPEHLDPSSNPDANIAQDSGSSVGSCSPPPSRLVPGVRVFAARGGAHVLGLSEDYGALHTHLAQALAYTQHMEEHTRDCNTAQCKNLASSVSSMQQVLEEANRLLKLFWSVTLPSDALRPQDEHLRTELSRLKSRLQQQECVLSGAVKRLHSTNQLKEGMERLIIDQLSVTHGILKKARGNLETHCYGLSGLPLVEGRPQWPLTEDQPSPPVPKARSTPKPDSASDISSHCSC